MAETVAAPRLWWAGVIADLRAVLPAVQRDAELCGVAYVRVTRDAELCGVAYVRVTRDAHRLPSGLCRLEPMGVTVVLSSLTKDGKPSPVVAGYVLAGGVRLPPEDVLAVRDRAAAEAAVTRWAADLIRLPVAHGMTS